MSTNGKICVICGQDVSQMKRTKDGAGNYYCNPCWTAYAQSPENVQTPTPVPARPVPPAASTPVRSKAVATNAAAKVIGGVIHSHVAVASRPDSPPIAPKESPVSPAATSDAPSPVSIRRPNLMTKISQVYRKRSRLFIYGGIAAMVILVVIILVESTASKYDQSMHDASETLQKMADSHGAEAKKADAAVQQYQTKAEPSQTNDSHQYLTHGQTARKQLESAMTDDPVLVDFLSQHPDLETNFKGVVNGNESDYHRLQLTMTSLSAGGKLSLDDGNHITQLLDECFK